MPKNAKIHYLKAVPDKTAPTVQKERKEDTSLNYEEIVKKLSQRMDTIEHDFRTTLHRMEHPEAATNLTPEDISSLIKGLESRIQRISEEIKQSPLIENQKERSSLLSLIDHIRRWMSLDHFKEFILSLWFGTPPSHYEVDEFGMDPSFITKVKPLFDFLYYNYWRVSVSGLKNIPNTGGALLVANHSGTLPYDGSMIAAAVVNEHPSRKDVRFLVEDFVYHFPFLGTFMYRIGGVRACPENAERLLTKKHLVTVFPEGIKGIGKHYRNRYHLQRFGRGGFIKLALKTKTPIIPTAVIGAEEIHPLIYKSTLLAKPFGIPYIPITPTLPLLGILGLIPLPSKWTVIFGDPIAFSEYSHEHAEDQLLVNRLSEMVRGKIQEMINDGLKNRRSVWFG